jgi:hypothetical protein
MFLEDVLINKEYLESLGWKVEEVYDQIFMVHDFVSEEERQVIVDMSEAATEEEWTHHYMNGVRSFALQKFGTDDIDSLVESGKLEITYDWVDKNLWIDNEKVRNDISKRIAKIISVDPELSFNGVGTIQRQYEGSELKVHVDNHTDPSLVWAVIMYINDEYDKGELIFPNLGISLKPPAGAMVMFPTHDGYLHGVNPPGPGPMRYVLPSFVGRSGFYETNKF